VGVVLVGKENYHERSRQIKHTLTFNEPWNGICEGEGGNALEKPMYDKDLAILENKNIKSYSLIVASINEEVSCYISPFPNSF